MPWEAIKTTSVVNIVFAMVLGLLGAAGAGAMVLRQDPVYSATATLLMDQPSAIAVDRSDGVLVKLSLLRNKYTALANSSRVRDPASKATGVPVAAMAGTRLVSPTNGLLVFSTSIGRDPARVQAMANLLAQQTSQFVVNEQNTAGVPVANQVTLSVIQGAGFGVKIRPTESHAREVAMIAGAIGILVAYVVLQLVTARRRLRVDD